MPVESMQGGFGSKQDLRYAENYNKAFESPDGKTNYALNYQPQFIAAKVSRTGLKYFTVKAKSAVRNTAAWRLLAALIGAVSAIYGWAIKQLNVMAQLQTQYTLAIAEGYDGTFHKWVCAGIRKSLSEKAAAITVVGPGAVVTLGNNPFSTAAEAIAISKQILVKFWKQLTPSGITFTIGDSTAIAVDGWNSNDLCNSGRLNVCNCMIETVGEDDYVVIGSQFLLDGEGAYISESYVFTDGQKISLTDVSPEA